MHESLTVESIKSDILSRLSADINTSEGSFINDMVSTVALEIWKTYQSMDALIPIAFVDETSGQYIDKRCAEYGIVRKSGTKAKTTLSFTGTDGTIIPEGKVFLTSEGLEYETNETVTIVSGTATVIGTAAEIGMDYNVVAGEINRQLVNINGLATVISSAATGGTDAETDASLVKRLYDYMQNPATSGNTAHYKQWALEVDGVGDAKVTPLWNGPGTVKVLIAGSDNGPVDSTIVDNCEINIEAKRPIGATVTVISASGLAINVDANVEIDESTTIETVKAAFESSLYEYLKSIAFEKYTIVYNRIAHLLLDIPGVIDYATLEINNGISNIDVGIDQVPVIGTVVIA